jgi:hypothetical protein
MSRPTSVVLILVGIGLGLFGLRIFGIEPLQYKWVLAISIWLRLSLRHCKTSKFKLSATTPERLKFGAKGDCQHGSRRTRSTIRSSSSREVGSTRIPPRKLRIGLLRSSGEDLSHRFSKNATRSHPNPSNFRGQKVRLNSIDAIGGREHLSCIVAASGGELHQIRLCGHRFGRPSQSEERSIQSARLQPDRLPEHSKALLRIKRVSGGEENKCCWRQLSGAGANNVSRAARP